MPGSHVALNALEVRRRLLVSEAEIHREQIRHEWADFKASFREIEGAANSVQSIVSVVSVLASSVSAFRRLRERRGGVVSKILAGAGLVSGLWFAFRSRSR